MINHRARINSFLDKLVQDSYEENRIVAANEIGEILDLENEQIKALVKLLSRARSQDDGEWPRDLCREIDTVLNLYTEHPCSYPDCGCDEARLCVGVGGPNSAALSLNRPKTRRFRNGR